MLQNSTGENFAKFSPEIVAKFGRECYKKQLRSKYLLWTLRAVCIGREKLLQSLAGKLLRSFCAKNDCKMLLNTIGKIWKFFQNSNLFILKNEKLQPNWDASANIAQEASTFWRGALVDRDSFALMKIGPRGALFRRRWGSFTAKWPVIYGNWHNFA